MRKSVNCRTGTVGGVRGIRGKGPGIRKLSVVYHGRHQDKEPFLQTGSTDRFSFS
jgi:hypothetical protein